MRRRAGTAVTSANYLAFDLGASSGRAVVGTLDDLCMHMQEVHRFHTPLRETGDHLHWDLDALWTEIVVGAREAARAVPSLRGIAVDSWGVDYVPLGADGLPVRDAYAYRDSRTRGRLAEAVARIPGGANALYDRTGIQFLEINTLPQIVADLADEPALVARTSTRLLIADYILYRLSGVPIAERTLASTTQLLDARTGAWAHDLIRALGDDPLRWPRLVAPGTILGPLRPGILHAAAAAPPVVIASCSHDTAAAVAATPSSGDQPWAFISSGTWSLVGVERQRPLLTPAARASGFTNEAGVDGTVRFLKNRTGLWVLEECMREWESARERPAYATLLAEATSAPPQHHTIDLNAREFGERGGMRAKIDAGCRANGFEPPSRRGGLVRFILESLAQSARGALEDCDALTGQRTEVVHVVGGGARLELLNQLTAAACGRLIVAGPDEAAALGNLLAQARALGDLPAGVSLREAARNSVTLTTYSPYSAAPTDAARAAISPSLHGI